MLLVSPLCRTVRRLSKLLWKELSGKLSKRFLSGKLIAARHSGHRNFPCFWLPLACFSRHSQQNVWKHDIVLGSVQVSRQMEQVTCCLTFSKRDSITIDKHEKTLSNQKKQLTPGGIDFNFSENNKFRHNSPLGANQDRKVRLYYQIGHLLSNLIFIVVWELYFKTVPMV